jgi:DNA polymerase eta
LRGYDDEGVKKDVDLKNKSILSLKNIKKTSSREIVEQSLELIVHDITMRVSDFYDDFNLVPSVLVVHYHNVIKGSHQKSEPIHLSLPVESFRLSIEDRVNSILKNLSDTELFPLIHIGISCRYFKPMTSGI